MFSPVLNIGVGHLGAKAITEMATHFSLRERWALPFASFNIIEPLDDEVQYKIVEYGSEQRIEELQGINEFVQISYQRLITLTRQIRHRVNFSNKQLNIVFSAFDEKEVQLAFELIKEVDKLIEKDIISALTIKCYVVLSSDSGVLRDKEQRLIYKTLLELSNLTEKVSSLTHVFVLDDYNTQSVYLGDGYDYLWFGLSEVVIAMMNNSYGMLANVFTDIRFYSFGLGMIYFDNLYFEAFFKKQIIKSRLHGEKLLSSPPGYTFNIGPYSKWVADYMQPFCDNKKVDIKELYTEIESVKPVLKNRAGLTLGDYQFNLNLLLGEPPKDYTFDPLDLYTVDDMIYSFIFHKILTSDEIEENKLLSVAESKMLAQDIVDKNVDLKEEYEAEIAEKLNELNESLENQLAIQHKYISDYKKRSTRQRIREKIENKLQSEREKVEEAIRRYDYLYHSQSRVCAFISKKKYKLKRNELESKLRDLQKQLRDLSTEGIIKSLDLLYAFKKRVIGLKKNFDGRINTLKSVGEEYESKFEKSFIPNYVYMQNIISDKTLTSYEKNNRSELQTKLVETIDAIIYDAKVYDWEFKNRVEDIIESTTTGIIDFDMIKYLDDQYESIGLFKDVSYKDRVAVLGTSQRPFFNAINGYQSTSHHLKYFCNEDNMESLNSVKSQLKGTFGKGLVPSFVKSVSKNKFALITIEVIQDLTHIAKYNYKE